MLVACGRRGDQPLDCGERTREAVEAAPRPPHQLASGGTIPGRLIGLEDLTPIRERTKRAHGKQTSAKQRQANRQASSWAFAEVRAYLAYKAVRAGSLTIRVDAYQTSQACPGCGSTLSDNCPGKGLLFVCQHPVWHLALHVDLIGARNMA